MPFVLSDQEHQMMAFVSESDLVDLAVELDYVPEAQIDRVALLNALIPRILDLAEREGLPFSKYDADDIAELPQHHRAALANRMGWPADPSGMLKQGEKVYKRYRKRRNSQVAVMLPMLISAVARCAHEGH
ncbi:MAG: hypothetical protein VX899_15065 [Myxococcota bacterium]|nr:hypothetical protein [Myxococcota bacterium]